MIMPAFTTLFPNATRKEFGYVAPIARTEFLHHSHHYFIFFLGPRTLDQTRIQHLLPTMETLCISSFLEICGDLFPIFGLGKNIIGFIFNYLRLPHISPLIQSIPHPFQSHFFKKFVFFQLPLLESTISSFVGQWRSLSLESCPQGFPKGLLKDYCFCYVLRFLNRCP